ncbi:hypothetical protein HPB52_002467 [Rhipicephalus sanguineus]|uniref:Transposable element P transposase-like GTP-binding insertion domain-containing protein n=1 Tax=Rhipicephalus sanguineus TaxID=34632 RepID=A0A9D4PYC5_RHISA|nr:hypothetical protein HPB52_002467 [Rhipicephalus sanguineus]
MKKEPPKERSSSSIQKRKRDSSTDTLASLPSQKIDSRPASAPEVRADTPKEVTEPSGWQQPESVSSSDIQDFPFVTAASDYCQSANILEPPDAQPAEEGAGARALRKHLYPSNIEKMGVKPAFQLFSAAVTAALSFMKDHAGHTCDAKFASVGPTVEFMNNVSRWFTLMDVSNCHQHIHQNYPDTRDAGCNDMLDVRSALSGLERMLKTGIVAASHTSNVRSSASFVSSGSIIRSGETSSTPSTSASAAVNSAQHLLHEFCTSSKPFLPTPDVAAVSLVAGYISRIVSKKTDYERCVSLVLKAKGSSTSATDGLISHQDRGGLCYPTPELVRVLHALKRFVDAMLLDRASLHKPLETCVMKSVDVIVLLPVLTCDRCDQSQRRKLIELVCRKFMKPLFRNHAVDFTDKKSVAKLYQKKPLSRKFLKL